MIKSLFNFVLTFFILNPELAFSKRIAPAEIKPIPFKRGTIYHELVQKEGGFSYYVFMKDKAEDERWRTKIFSKKYMENLETDVQDIHLKKLFIEDDKVIAIDEKNRTYELDLDSGSILKPNQSSP